MNWLRINSCEKIYLLTKFWNVERSQLVAMKAPEASLTRDFHLCPFFDLKARSSCELNVYRKLNRLELIRCLRREFFFHCMSKALSAVATSIYGQNWGFEVFTSQSKSWQGQRHSKYSCESTIRKNVIDPMPCHELSSTSSDHLLFKILINLVGL